MPDDGDWLTVGEAARLMEVSEWKVRQMADSGALESAKVPDSAHRRISRASAEAHRLRPPTDTAGQTDA